MRPGDWLLVCYLILVSAASTAQHQRLDPGFVHVQAVDVVYSANQDYPGLNYAILSGNPDSEGTYVLRLRIPPGLTFPPHYHDQDRHVTVISGTWAFGTGDSGECDDTTPLTAGAYAMHPKGAVHFDGACGDGPVEVQITGEGPVTTTWIDGAAQ